MNITLSKQPFPHFICDDFLHTDVLRDMRRNWPGIGNFVPEIPGNFICPIAKFSHEGFWKSFKDEVYPQILGMTFTILADYIKARFPGETNFSTVYYGLMQSAGNYGGHDVHNHHYHDPTWVATILIYLDAEENGHNGTTILRTKPGLDEAEIAAQTLNWHDTTEEVKTVEYKQGRLLCFYDNPVAYHSVKPSSPTGLFGRRILRFHIGASTDHCQRFYGVDLQTFQKKREQPSNDPQVVGWMKKDIDAMRSVEIKMTDDERSEWLGTILLNSELGMMKVA